MDSKRKSARGILGIVFVTVFLDLIGFGILIPIQPFYAESFGARPATVTLLSASFSLVQFVFAPVLGRMSDRVGRRPVMLATIAINVVGYLSFGLAQSLAMLFLARMISGFGSANLGTAQAIVAESTTPETRARGMGIIGMAFGLGFIFGPAIGGFFGQFGLAVPAFVAAGLSLANLALAWFRLPETGGPAGAAASLTPKPSRSAAPETRAPGLWRSLRNAAGKANVPQLFWIYFVGTVAFSLMEQAIGLFIERAWVLPAGQPHSSPEQLRQAAALTAWFLVAAGTTFAFVQGVMIGPLARRYGERSLLLAGTAVMAAGLLLIPVTAGLGIFPVFLALGPLLASGSGLTSPSLPSLLSQTVRDESLGGTMGLGHSLSALGRVVGPSMSGLLFEIRPDTPFLAGSALMTTCTVVALLIRRNPADGPGGVDAGEALDGG